MVDRVLRRLPTHDSFLFRQKKDKSFVSNFGLVYRRVSGFQSDFYSVFHSSRPPCRKTIVRKLCRTSHIISKLSSSKGDFISHTVAPRRTFVLATRSVSPTSAKRADHPKIENGNAPSETISRRKFRFATNICFAIIDVLSAFS